MPIKHTSTNVVVGGAWNPAIITPHWLSQYKVVDDLKESPQPWSDPDTGMSGAKIGNKYLIGARLDRLEVTAFGGGDGGAVVARILGLLPHTPVRSVATGFVFICELEDLPASKLPLVRPFGDMVEMQTLCVRRLGDGILQVTVSQQTGKPIALFVGIRRNVADAARAAALAAAWSAEREVAIGAVKEMFGADVYESDK